MCGRLEKKVVIVTGAGSIGPGWGNGKAVAALFARQGAKVFAVDPNESAVAETASIIADEGGECTAHVADVTVADEVEALVARCVEIYGRVDILHNNVGIVDDKNVLETTEETWDNVMSVNLKSMFLTCKNTIPVMKTQGGGVIVNVGSISGIRWNGVPWIAYYTSKAGVLGFSRAIALDHAKDGIRCNALLPGSINTPLMLEPKRQTLPKAEFDKWVAARDTKIPIGRTGTAWDVAYGALFLASDDSEYVTATQLVVDGGLIAQMKMPQRPGA